jgi:hypothetical protein
MECKWCCIATGHLLVCGFVVHILFYFKINKQIYTWDFVYVCEHSEIQPCAMASLFLVYICIHLHVKQKNFNLSSLILLTFTQKVLYEQNNLLKKAVFDTIFLKLLEIALAKNARNSQCLVYNLWLCLCKEE